MDRTQQIAELNDRCRQYLGASGRLVVSSGIASLDPDKQRRILMRVQNHRRFDEGNDPYGEHDFGALNPTTVGFSGRSTTTIRRSPTAAKIPPIQTRRCAS